MPLLNLSLIVRSSISLAKYSSRSIGMVMCLKYFSETLSKHARNATRKLSWQCWWSRLRLHEIHIDFTFVLSFYFSAVNTIKIAFHEVVGGL